MIASAEEIQGRFRMTDGFDLFYRRWKTPSKAKRAVVCIRGMGEHSGFFRFIGQGLASHGEAEVYAIDLRGFGNSRKEGLPIGDTSDFKKYLRDVAEVVEYVRKDHSGKKLFMFGHSMGGLHALWYAASSPDPPDGLLLAGSSAAGSPRGRKFLCVPSPNSLAWLSIFCSLEKPCLTCRGRAKPRYSRRAKSSEIMRNSWSMTRSAPVGSPGGIC